MDIRFVCDSCGQRIAVDESGAGLTIDCPNCQQPLSVPAASTIGPRASASTPPVAAGSANPGELAEAATAPRKPALRLKQPAAPPRPIVTRIVRRPPPSPARPPLAAVAPAPALRPATAVAGGTTYRCANPECGGVWAESEVRQESFGGQLMYTCPTCHLVVKAHHQKPVFDFWAQTGSAFVYPFRGNGIWIIGLGTPLLAFLQFASKFGLAIVGGGLAAIAAGFFGMLFMDIIRVSADDETKTIEWPDVTSYEELMSVAQQFGLSGLLVFSPAIICFLMGSGWLWFDSMPGRDLLETSQWMMLAMVLAIAGIPYYPMAMLAVSMQDTIGGVHPLVVLPAIFRVPFKYLVVVVLLGILFFVRQTSSGALVLLPLSWRFGLYLPIEFFTLYSLVVSARILGLLYRDSGESFGWI